MLMVRLAQMDDEGKLADHHASLAKAFCHAKSRETVDMGPRALGRQRYRRHYNVARFFATPRRSTSTRHPYQCLRIVSRSSAKKRADVVVGDDTVAAQELAAPCDGLA